MELFASNNCVYTFQRRASQTGFALAGLYSSPPVIVQGAQFADQDIVLPINTLNKKKFIYSFGTHFSDGQLMGVVLMGMSGGASLVSFVQSIRTSGGGDAVSLSTPLGGYRVYVTGFGLSTPDAEFNLQPFSILFKIAS
mgnify:CR=1 FL=1